MTASKMLALPEHQIINISEILLIGNHKFVTDIEPQGSDFLQNFQQSKSEILNTADDENIYAIFTYAADHFKNYHPGNAYIIWTALQVNDYNRIPKGMEAITIPPGKYAVFNNTGKIFDRDKLLYLTTGWLPKSNYKLDNRPFFELIHSNIFTNPKEAEVSIWIPIS